MSPASRPRPEPSEVAREAPGFIPAVILRNKGVPITLLRLEHGEPMKRPEDLGDEDDWERPTRTFWLRFTANHVADIEDAFDGLRAVVPKIERTVTLGPDDKPLEGPAGPVYDEKVVGEEERVFYGIEAFQKAMEVKVGRSVRKVLSIALGVTEEEAGEAMDPGRMIEYQTAVGVAWAMAQGVDPTDAAQVLKQATEAADAARSNLASELRKTMVPASG